MSERLTFHATNGNLAVKFDGKTIPAEKLPALFDLLAADVERRANQLSNYPEAPPRLGLHSLHNERQK